MRITLLTVKVVDVLGRSWPATLNYELRKPPASSPSQTSLPAGGGSIRLDAEVLTLVLSVSHEQFASQRSEINLDAQGVSWTNANYALRLSDADLIVTVTLCRIREAPTIEVPKELYSEPTKAGKRFDLKSYQDGIWIDPEDSKKRYVGIGRRKSDEPVKDGYPAFNMRTLVDQGTTALVASQTDGWSRFSFADDFVDISQDGGFKWLEYGAVESRRAKPTFLVGLWAPRSVKQPIDIILNFGHSPTASSWIPYTTFPGGSDYPYGAVRDGTGFPQRYPTFGLLYYFSTASFAFSFVYQAAASKRSAVIVMPVIPKVDDTKNPNILFQPFNSRAGIHRLLLEVVQFLHQSAYPSLFCNFATWEGRSAMVGQIPRSQPVITWRKADPWADVSNVVPNIGNVVVVGHSTGTFYIKALLEKSAAGTSNDIGNTSLFPPDFYGADIAKFDKLWRELWDLDLSFDGFPGWRERYQDLLLNWLKQGQDRRGRLYHSSETTTAEGFKKFLEAKSLPWMVNPTKMTNPVAEDWRTTDGRVTAMFFSRKYLTAANPPTTFNPVFPSPSSEWSVFHQFAMILGFGHAAKARLQS
jgi:hypothetical protein